MREQEVQRGRSCAIFSHGGDGRSSKGKTGRSREPKENGEAGDSGEGMRQSAHMDNRRKRKTEEAKK